MNIYKKAVETFGIEHQAGIATEECAELIVALNHFFNRDRGSKEEVITELADVIIVTEQLVEHFGHHEVYAEVKRKLARLENTIEEFE